MSGPASLGDDAGSSEPSGAAKPTAQPVARPGAGWGGGTPARRAARLVEMLAIFFGLPGGVALFTDPRQRVRPVFERLDLMGLYEAALWSKRLLLPMLVVFAGIAAIALARSRAFDSRRLWNASGLRRDLPRILGLFVVGMVVMFAAAWWLDASTGVMRFVGRDGVETTAFLRLPREAPLILLFIAIGYPWLSAYPQEILHRAYFFHRYRVLFRGPVSAVAVNAVAFSWLHAPFWSVEALLLTLPGGVLFAWTYLRTHSTLAAGVEHALYGWWAFAVGLGWFVFTGSIGT